MLPSYLNLSALDDLITRALAEDVGAGDVTTEATIPVSTEAEGRFLVKETGVVAGLTVAERVFHLVDETADVRWLHEDGAVADAGTVVGTASGRARSLLTTERLALNLLQRMSGIATVTRAMVEQARPARMLDTRKTAPGLRLLDKWAVLLGGGENHRLGLYDRILIKDNHIAAAGGLREALHAARRYQAEAGPNLPIEIEARTLDEVRAVVEDHRQHGGVDYILLDNMTDVRADGQIVTERLREAVALVGGTIATEASGNVTLETVGAIGATGVDFISSGALTHSVKALDLSLKIHLQETHATPPARHEATP